MEIKREMSDGEQPDEVPATEVVVLHDPEAEKSLNPSPSSSRPRTTTDAATRR